jgi:hypothetical protein
VKRRIQIAVLVVLVLGGAYAAYRIWFTPLAGDAKEEGDRAPAFALSDHLGSAVTLDSLLENGPAVVIFYRGHW